MKSIFYFLLLLVTVSTSADADTIYVPDYSNANTSSWNTTSGGVIDVPYVLNSGTPVAGIGTSFNVPYQVQLSGVAGTGYFVPVGTVGNDLSFRPNDVGTQPTLGSSFVALFNLGAPPAAGPGWNLVGQNVRQSFSGFTGSTSNVIAQLQTPFDLVDHGQSGTYTWDVSVGGLGLNNFIGNSPRYDSRGVSFSGFVGNDPTDFTNITFRAVPEPSAATVSLMLSAMLLGRRRR